MPGDEPEWTPAIGHAVGNGRYTVGGEINRGGTAVVYEGFDNALGMKVALKVRRAVTRPDARLVSHTAPSAPRPQVMNVSPNGTIAVPLPAVKREIKYASKLGSRVGAQSDMNIVRLLNVLQEGEVRPAHQLFDQNTAVPHSLVFFPQDILILVWELVKGMDVLDYLNSLGGVMTEPEARHFFRQLLSGIRCIHDNGFCHRDIKPENCMIEMNTGSLKIIDFGLSKHRDSAKTVGIGTPDYMSPEMLSRAGGVGGSEQASYDPEAVDVWAMGVMLYLILTGVYPFEDVSQPGNVTATLRRVREGRMNKLPSNLSASVRDLLTRMIRVDPAGERGSRRSPNTPGSSPERPWARRASRDRRTSAWAAHRGAAPPGPRADQRGRGMRLATRRRYLRRRRPRRSRWRSAFQEYPRRWRLDRFHLRRTHHLAILRVLPLAGGLNDAGTNRRRERTRTERMRDTKSGR